MYPVRRVMPRATPPSIVVTLAVAAEHAQPDLARRRNELYLEAVRRHGGVPLPLDAGALPSEREAAFEAMDGLLLSGGTDIDPARYGQPELGSREVERKRDELESRAWEVARHRDIPILGICRGLQAINVFSGGSLVQHVEGHAGAGWGSGAPATHPIELVPGTRLATLLEADAGERPVVNAYHHQGIRESDLAPGLVAAAWADSSAGPLVEGLESAEGSFLVGVQCHPERTESTPAAFERLFAAFVEAARNEVSEARTSSRSRASAHPQPSRTPSG
jgi:putative glutamine amidotransferase